MERHNSKNPFWAKTDSISDQNGKQFGPKRKAFWAKIALASIAMTAQAQDFCFDEVVRTPSETTFRLFAPDTAPTVTLRIYADGQGGEATQTITMKRTSHDMWTATVNADLNGRYYTFDTGLGETPGVFARAVGVNGRRGAIIDMDKTNPDGWADDRLTHPARFSDWIIYEMHHRDFSINRKDARHPGKYLALTEPWAIDHLKRLGITAVHILPSYDYGSVDETHLDRPQYNWGYDPVNYNVPEGSYSTDPYDPATRIHEFKQMVQALHRAGIAVILDVVYNHTYDIEHSNFQRTYPDYYYRVGSNGSGCGNETASERPMMRQFMIESVKYWIREYHIDGFRFDLMGCHDIETMNLIRQAVDQIDPTIFIYGEGWSAGQCALPNDELGMKANVKRMPRIAAFSDDLRDALRGPFSDDTKAGWLADPIANNGLTESLKAGICGMIAHPQVDYSLVNYSTEPYALEPTQMISYVSCHDDMCLTDRLRASTDTDEESIARLDLLAQTAVMTSQGVPFMLSGEELLRTKQGVHNSFESPDSINQLDWTPTERHQQALDYYRGLINMRRQHPAFRLGSADLVRSHLEFLKTKPGVVAYRLKGSAGGDEWRDIIVVLNADSKARNVRLPRGKYTVVCSDGRIDCQGMGTTRGGRITVQPQSALIVHQ